MKNKVIIPLICLALLIAVPQAEAQSKRSERKLKREMQKLEKQMKKVNKLKQESFLPLMEEFELKKVKELEKIHEFESQRWEMSEKQRRQFKKQAELAREMAEQYRESNHERIHEYQEQAREHQREAQEHLRRTFENQRYEYKKLRELHPDGIHIEEIEIPEFDFELPEFDLDFPEMEFDFEELEGKLPQYYRGLVTTAESDNNLSIKTELDNESIDKTYNFTVADEAVYVSLRARGSVSSGNIDIKIMDPQDKEYQTIELSSAADVDWSQKVKLNDEKKKNLKGKWTIRVKGDDVVGHFGLTLRSK